MKPFHKLLAQSLIPLATLLAVCLGASPGGAQPTPISACNPSTILFQGSYVLTQNLLANAGLNCLTLSDSSRNITIDFAGFTIFGTHGDIAGQGNGIGQISPVPLEGGYDIVIRNGMIQGFGGAGILLSYFQRVKIENMNVQNNQSGGILVGTTGIVRDNIVELNGTCPTVSTCAGYGIYVGSSSLVTGNISMGNRGAGILAGFGSVIIGNTAGHNSGDGIVTQQDSNILHNGASNNDADGIRVQCPSYLDDNIAQGNVSKNFEISSGRGCVNRENLF